MDINGNIIEGKRKPSSEHELHRIFYQHRNDINAVVHTHSVYSTILATLHEPLPASSYFLDMMSVVQIMLLSVRLSLHKTHFTLWKIEMLYLWQTMVY